MSIRFVIGRAASGKTHRCLEAVRARLRENPVRGNKLLLLVPEQASFQMERALIETPDLPGFVRCEVLSFQRLAHRIFAETGADPRRADQTIGPLGRMMAIRRLIRRERGNLRLLKGVADKPGLVKQVATAIDELMRERIEPEALAEAALRSEGENPLQSAKMADLVRLYRAYLDYLIDDRLDPAQHLSLAAERLPACTSLAGAEVWVDGFAGFTAQEYALIAALARHVTAMEITVLVDPASAASDAREPTWEYSLFARTQRTLVRLQRELSAAGTGVGEPIRLAESHFKAPALAWVEQRLFQSSGQAPEPPPAETLAAVEVSDPRAEVAAAVAEIQRLTRERGMRYRDIAIIVRDLGPYHDLISAAMASAGIPCFIDRRQPTAHHPLVELVRSLLAVAADDCRLDSARLTLKTGLLPLTHHAADLLENYLLASGIQGTKLWRQPWQFRRFFGHQAERKELAEGQLKVLEHINGLRRKWLEYVGPWLEFAEARPEPTGRQWAEALFAALDGMGVDSALAAWADAAEAGGRADEAEAHRQVWADFAGLLDEFVKALGSEPMRIDEFRETLESGLAEFTLGLAPPTLDQVLVGAVERSRHPNVRAVLILGFDESHFPMRRSEDPMLGDAERESLEAAGVELGPSRRRQLLDERMLAYIALTRASERVWISCPRNDAEGKPVQPSPFLPELLGLFAGWKPERQADARLARQPAGIVSVSDLAGRLASEFRYRSAVQAEATRSLRATWNALYEAARQKPEWQKTLQAALAGLGYRNEAQLEPGLMDRAAASPFLASVSRLEQYAACPFSHFVGYTLGLEERPEAELRLADVGTICHIVLERLVKQLIDKQQSIGELEDDEIRERIDTIATELAPEIGDFMMLGEPRNAFLFDRSRGHLQRVTRWQRDAARAGCCRPEAVEFAFGFTAGPGGTVNLTTPGGRTILLRGRIDRVDIAELGTELVGTVIDYKRTTDKRLDLAQVFYGLSLQLVGYLIALQQCGESLAGRPIRPVGAFYLSLLEPYQSVAHPNEETASSFKWRGLADVSAAQVLDGDIGPGSSSRFYSARLTKEGRPYPGYDLAQPAEMQAVMRHVAKRMGEIADALLDGNIEIRPYRLRRHMPCAYCRYRAICRYEIETQNPRTLQPMRRADALQQIMKEAGHA